MMVVPSSLAEAARLVPGGAKTSVPAGASTTVAVELEHGVAAQHEKELLVSGGVVLVVLVDDGVARDMGRPSRHSERRDAQVVPDRPVVAPDVLELLDLVQMCNRVTSHGTHRRGQAREAGRIRARTCVDSARR